MRALALLTAALALAGCSIGGGDGGDATVEQDELAGAVLQPDDVPRVFLRFDEGRQGLGDVQGRRRSAPERFGRVGGWKARYRRAGSNRTEGPLVIASLVDAFDSQGGAEKEWQALEDDFGGGDVPWTAAEAPGLGDESLAWTLVQGAGAGRVAFFVVAWREDNAVASLEANGFAGKLELAEAVALARKQADRLARAAAS
ncbi:MAG TPA: hypothetical protein VFM13_01115 [Gaiellaceae bacterium]|nr:hypothetical protein [Gaiellaceae bacterium]